MHNFKKEPTAPEEQSLWINNYITIGNKCIYGKTWENAGILYINHIN